VRCDSTAGPAACAQAELSRNKCRPQRIDIWQQAVDTDVFSPAFRSEAMRARMSGGRPDAVILTYVGRLGAGTRACTCLTSNCLLNGMSLLVAAW
jgi:sulfoquinovosyltransferase